MEPLIRANMTGSFAGFAANRQEVLRNYPKQQFKIQQRCRLKQLRHLPLCMVRGLQHAELHDV